MHNEQESHEKIMSYVTQGIQALKADISRHIQNSSLEDIFKDFVAALTSQEHNFTTKMLGATALRGLLREFSEIAEQYIPIVDDFFDDASDDAFDFLSKKANE